MTILGVRAQDVIVKHDGCTILAKVVKVASKEIEYKKYSNQEGPTYVILLSDVKAINYENGEKDVFEPKQSNSNEAVSTPATITPINETSRSTTTAFSNMSLAKYQEKEDLLRSSRTNRTWGAVCLVTGITTAAAGLLLSEGILGVLGSVPSGIMIGGGVLLACTSGILYGKAASQRREANIIRVASIHEKKFNIGDNLTVSPGLKLMTFNGPNNSKEYGVGLGASITF